jgi:hypothetical protein
MVTLLAAGKCNLQQANRCASTRSKATQQQYPAWPRRRYRDSSGMSCDRVTVDRGLIGHVRGGGSEHARFLKREPGVVVFRSGQQGAHSLGELLPADDDCWGGNEVSAVGLADLDAVFLAETPDALFDAMRSVGCSPVLRD